MLPILRRPLLRLPPSISSVRAFSVSASRADTVLDKINQGIALQREDNKRGLEDRRTHRDVPVNPPPTRLTVDSPEYTRTGAVALTNGDPIGFPTSAKGIEDPEEAYWFGVLGYQHYAEEHEEHERGWHNELDGFRRVDETGPHYNFESGRFFEEYVNEKTGKVERAYHAEWDPPSNSWFHQTPTRLGCMIEADGRKINGT